MNRTATATKIGAISEMNRMLGRFVMVDVLVLGNGVDRKAGLGVKGVQPCGVDADAHRLARQRKVGAANARQHGLTHHR